MAHPYIYPSRVLVYDLINTENNTRYNPSDVTIENIRPDTRGVDFRNTYADVVGIVEEGFDGQVTVRYRRLDLGTVFQKCTIMIPWMGESSTLELAARINGQYGTKLSAEDIVLEYFNPNTLPIGITLTVQEDSPAWMGQLNVTVVEFSQPLPEGVVNQVINPFTYPTGQVEKAQGPMYLRPYLFDAFWPVLSELTVGPQTPVVSGMVLGFINGKLPPTYQWVLSETATQRNLYGGKSGSSAIVHIAYVGAPKLPYTTRLDVDSIIVIALSEDRCTGVAGYLVMHFSDPSFDLDESIVNKDIGAIRL